MNIKNFIVTLSVGVLAVCASTIAFAGRSAEIDGDATAALAQFYQQNPLHQQLADRAVGMLVFPHVVKGGAGVSGEYGEGVLMIEGRPVRHYAIEGGSMGLTLGAAEHSEVIMFMTESTLMKFVTSKGWTVGPQTGVAVVSQGAGGTYDSDTLRKPVLGFVFGENGLIGDISFAGLKISKLNGKS
jgi:lipid-binding SYLF domain-containing protein